MNELLEGKRQQWVYDYRFSLGISFVLKGQIAGGLLDLLSSHFKAYFSDTLLLLGVVIWRRHHIRYLLIQRVGEKNYQFYQLGTVRFQLFAIMLLNSP